MPSPATGVLSSILVSEGETVPMGTVIAEMEVEGGEPPASVPKAAATREVADRVGTLLKDVAPVGPTGSGGPISAAPTEAPESGGTAEAGKRLSPAVMRLAAEHDVDPSEVSGTGIGGRVTRKDVKAHVDARGAVAGTPSDEERVPLTPVRRMIAANMVRSATEIPEAWTVVEADLTGLVALRERARERFQQREGVNLTYLPFVLKVVAESLKANPLVNSRWDGDAIILKRRVHIGVAIATAEGLVVPVVHDADSLSVAGLARAIDDLATRARQGKLAVEDVRGGTFTVNNTGALGSVTGKGLINHPQAAILNTESIVKRPVVIDDAIAIRSIMNLCLTFDHRILDGAEAGAFVGDVKRRLEAMRPDMGVS
jgi:2-oxoisovalerate dehydrogenase E2 component (dihydrolipoyl transacylase)